ncbi:B-cell receptor CD22-like [Poecilia reticulata]|uniref:B-cell receptor CD22-like n=1 Tax=Poecilia reticulata TaxID=8081 RepID=UPI0004A45375|nr:PREDICTED: B-cell receptor CD22-like [Poecilia reticulata]
MAALSENMLTINMVLSVFFFPGTLADCVHELRLFISSPQTMKALSATCLHIPCKFRIKPEENLDGGKPIKIKNDVRFALAPQNVVFNSSKSVNIFQMNIAGNLRERDCTTIFSNLLANQSNTYFFRIENGRFMSTASCNPLQIGVQDSPWSPSINVPSDLKEHQSVTVTCSAFTPCPNSPPELTWNLQQDSLRQTEENTDGTFTTKIQESITLSDTHDGYNIRCSAKHPAADNVVQTEVTLSVSYAPKDTLESISPSGLVPAGSWVELSCSSRAKPPPSFTWFKKGPQISTQVATGIFHKVQFTQGGQYFCVAANTLGSQKSSPVSVRTKGLPGLWMYIVIAILGIGLLRSTHFMIKKWIQASSSSQAH